MFKLAEVSDFLKPILLLYGLAFDLKDDLSYTELLLNPRDDFPDGHAVPCRIHLLHPTKQVLDVEAATSASHSQHEVKCALLFNAVIAQRPEVFQLHTSEYDSLLIGRDSFLVLDLHLKRFNGIPAVRIDRDSFSSQSFHKDLKLPIRCTASGKRHFASHEFLGNIVHYLFIGNHCGRGIHDLVLD